MPSNKFPTNLKPAGRPITPVPAAPEFEALMEHFAALNADEIQAYEADLQRRIGGRPLAEAAQADGQLMRDIGNLSLIPPVINTHPGPEYGYDKLNYGMTIGIERTAGGRLWAVWVAGEDGPRAFMVAATSDDDGETWSPHPRFVVDSQSPGLPVPRSVIVGALWTDPQGRLWFFFDQTLNHHDGRQGLWASICANPDADDPTWSAPVRLDHGVVLNKPIVRSNGEWLLPAYLLQRDGKGPMAGVFPELAPEQGAHVLVSRDAGASWTRRGSVCFQNPDWHETEFIELRDGRLWMAARTRPGGAGPAAWDAVRQVFSADGGWTWSEPETCTFRHPAARFHLRRLASGRILLVKHGAAIDANEGRISLTAWLSEDEGKTWRGGLMLDEREHISYPDGTQAPDGTIFISYDRERSRLGEILMARITEADIIAGRLVGASSRLQMPIFRIRRAIG